MIDLSKETKYVIGELCRSLDKWIKFMEFVGHNYKYSFENQLVMFAQRPEATAVATFDFWNTIRRRINRGERAIRTYDKNHSVIANLFDVSQTNGDDEYFRTLKWKYEADKHSQTVMRLLKIEADRKLDFKSLIYVTSVETTEERLAAVSSAAAEDIDIIDIIVVSSAYALATRLDLNVSFVGKDSHFWKGYDKIRDKRVLAKILQVSSEITSEILKITERGIKNEYRKEQANIGDVSRFTTSENGERDNIYVRPAAGRNAVLQSAVRADARRGLSASQLGTTSSAVYGRERTMERVSSDTVKDLPQFPAESGRRNNGEYIRPPRNLGEEGISGKQKTSGLRETSKTQSGDKTASGGNSNQPDVGKISSADERASGMRDDTSHAAEKRNTERADKKTLNYGPSDGNSDGFYLPENLYQPTLEEIISGKVEVQTSADMEEAEPTLENLIEKSKANTSFSSDFTDIAENEFTFGGAKTRFKDNIEAIKMLKKLEEENRMVTSEEQIVLSKYIGWGGLSQAFDEQNESWKNEYIELKTLLSDDEYKAARASCTTAFYTPQFVVRAIYKTLENFGFENGRILDPSAGTARFFTSMPEKMRKASELHGVELDDISGRIARQLVPNAKIAIQGFEKSVLQDEYFDVAVSNVPFGDIRVDDALYKKHNFLIHDYFFAKSIDKVRSGGIVVFITSSGTLDKANEHVRKYIFERCDLIGAVRLPNTAFKSANTEATSDIIFLKKRSTPNFEVSPYVGLEKLPNGVRVNAYFAQHPEMLLGEMVEERGMYGAVRPTLKPDCMPEELPAQLDDVLRRMTFEYEPQTEEETQMEKLLAGSDDENFCFTVKNDKVYYCENGILTEKKLSARETERVSKLCEIRSMLKDLLDMQITDCSDEKLKEQRERLNTLYDSFVSKFGNLHKKENKNAFSEDIYSSVVLSLEESSENGAMKKAAIFSIRTARPKIKITSAETAADALAICVNEIGKVDFGYIAKLYNKSEKEIQEELTGKIFKEPRKNEWQTADEYLSGNVRTKLDTARVFAESNPEFNENVKALEKVLPKWIETGDIFVSLGTYWIDLEYYRQFTYELLNTPNWKREVEGMRNQNCVRFSYNKYLSQYTIHEKGADKSINATRVYGTERINAYEIIEQSLNMHDVVIKDAVEYTNDNGSKSVKYVVNSKETAIAREKQEEIRAAFKEWIFKDTERRKILTEKYNRLFNSTRQREFSGEGLKIPDMSDNISLRSHQLNAVARLRSGENVLLDHVVGAGKTFTMIAGAKEQIRLGLANKVLFVVPNHLTEQFGSDIFKLFPSAKAMIARKKDFEKENRRRFLSRIALSDAEMIVIGHSQFEKLSMSKEYRIKQMEDEVLQLSSVIAQLKEENGKHYSVKQFENMKVNLQVKIEKLNSDVDKDKMLDFEQLGINSLFVDEAHYYKNCAVYSKMRNVAGISNASSLKSSDMLMKCRYLSENGGIITFATGTPISNSITEMYVMQRYLQEDELHSKGIDHFDQWAATFGEQTASLELAPEGSGYRMRTRFAKFHNLPELMQMYREIADVQTADMLKLPIPEMENGKPMVVACEPSEALEQFMEDAIERVRDIRNRRVSPNVDNMLKFTNDAKKAGLDMRLLNPALPRDEGGKVSACAELIYKNYAEFNETKGTQLVFCDTSTPSAGNFNVYDDLKTLLIEKGIPENEIAFIHSAKSETEKDEMFAKVRSGDIRILIGSTQKMGAGTNVQERLIALHHLDCPYRPSDIEQREGRILRQGNKNETVRIYRYVTKRSFDAYLWNIVETKQKFISQLRRGGNGERSCEDVDEAVLSFAEAQAIASGDPRIKEKIEVDAEVSRLQMLKSQHMNEQYRFEDDVNNKYPQLIETNNRTIAAIKADIETLNKNKTEEFQIKIGERWYDNREKAGEKIIAQLKSLTAGEEKEIAEFKGFKITVKQAFIDPKIIVSGALRYFADVNIDSASGTTTRLENAVREIPHKLEAAEAALAENTKSLEIAKQSLGKPFLSEERLNTLLKRQSELNAALSFNDKDNIIADDMPEENEEEEIVEEEITIEKTETKTEWECEV